MEFTAQPYLVPPGKGLGRSLVLAVAMHGLLVLMLVLGLSWRSAPPAVVDAELWSALPQQATTTVEPPRPVPVETPKPVAQVEPEPIPVLKPDIVLKREVPKKLPELTPPPVEQKLMAPKQPPKIVPPVKPATPSAMSQLMAQANHESTGTDQQSSGPKGDNSYGARLVAKIRPRVQFPALGAAGNPTVRVQIEQLPTGDVTNVTIVKSSGLPEFDSAVQRGILAASPLPRDAQGNVSRSVQVDYSLYDRPAN